MDDKRVLLLMDERRKYKNVADGSMYRNSQRLIRSKIRTAKNEWLKRECIEIEQLQNQHEDLDLRKSYT